MVLGWVIQDWHFLALGVKEKVPAVTFHARSPHSVAFTNSVAAQLGIRADENIVALCERFPNVVSLPEPESYAEGAMLWTLVSALNAHAQQCRLFSSQTRQAHLIVLEGTIPGDMALAKDLSAWISGHEIMVCADSEDELLEKVQSVTGLEPAMWCEQRPEKKYADETCWLFQKEQVCSNDIRQACRVMGCAWERRLSERDALWQTREITLTFCHGEPMTFVRHYPEMAPQQKEAITRDLFESVNRAVWPSSPVGLSVKAVLRRRWDEPPGQDETELEKRLREQLGEGRVFYLAAGDDTNPRLDGVEVKHQPTHEWSGSSLRSLNEPSFLYREPLPLKAVHGQPQHYGDLTLLQPTRLSKDGTRLYFRASREDGTLLWLSKRLSDEQWFLEGEFS